MTPIGARKGLDDAISSRFFAEGYTLGGASVAVGVAKRCFFVPVKVLATCVLTGLTYQVGGVASGNVKAGLYRSEGGEVLRLVKSAEVAQAAAENFQRLPFSAAFTAIPDEYWLALIFSAAAATAYSAYNMSPWLAQTEATVEVPATFVLPTEPNNTGVKPPMVSTY